MGIVLAVALLSVATALTCALPGVFLVLRHQSMLVDAMSHAVLPGIVIGALISGTLHSPIMVILAAGMGMLVVIGADLLRRSGLVTGDANQGLIFPALFSVGVLLLSTVLTGVHIDERCVLAGNLNLEALPSEHVLLGFYDIGPATMWKELAVLGLTAAFLVFTYPVLKLSTLDPQLAKTMGMPVRTVDYGLLLMVSITVVAAFEAAGSILVVALMVVPAATALLFARTLRSMLVLTLSIAAGGSLLGFWVAYQWDLATSSMMACVDGLLFLALMWGQKAWQARLRSQRRTQMQQGAPA